MLIPGPSGVYHVTYCTNVHGGETWDETFAELRRYLPAVRAAVRPDRAFGVGLRLSAAAAVELKREDRLEAFADWLKHNSLYVFTVNGFPYGKFHGAPVKDRVFAPDWCTPERVSYTLDLIEILQRLLPDGVRGSISTVPLSYKPWFTTAQERVQAMEQSARDLAIVARQLRQVERQCGKLIRLGLEPEPDGLVGDIDELITFFASALAGAGEPEDVLRRYVGACFDTCHASVQYESPAEALAKLDAAGIALTKIQLSSALRVEWDGCDEIGKRELLNTLSDPVYLHQVRSRGPFGQVRGYGDLDRAVMEGHPARGSQWRIHFHVPLFVESYGALQSTRDDTRETIVRVQSRYPCDHLEIETYTWSILPAPLKAGLVESIAKEFDWTLSQLGEPPRAACAEQRS